MRHRVHVKRLTSDLHFGVMALTEEQRSEVKGLLDDLQTSLLGEFRKGLRDQAKGFTEEMEGVKSTMKTGADEVAGMKLTIDKAMGELQATVTAMGISVSGSTRPWRSSRAGWKRPHGRLQRRTYLATTPSMRSRHRWLRWRKR